MDESYIFNIHEYMEVEHGISEQCSEQHEHQERHEQCEQLEQHDDLLHLVVLPDR
jgi:hypothetical protein